MGALGEGLVRAVAAFFAFLSSASLAIGSEAVTMRHPGFDHAVFAFGGRVAESDILAMANPFTVEYGDNFVAGMGYQRFVPGFVRDLYFGFEAGAAARFGQSFTAEAWGGPVVRYDGIRLFNAVTLSPSITGGLSAVTDAMHGWEGENEVERDGDATLLFYFGPELSLSLASRPDLEIFWRLHHRSGAWGTLGDMHGGANFQTLGIRHRF